MDYIDTNILVRSLSQDDPEKAARTDALLQEVEQGRRLVATTEAVIAEVIYVLSSKKTYHMARAEIVRRLLPVLMFKGLKIGSAPSEKQMYADALKLYATTQLDFTDALLLARMKQDNVSTIISFDTDFDAFQQIKRCEPQKSKKNEKPLLVTLLSGPDAQAHSLRAA